MTGVGNDVEFVHEPELLEFLMIFRVGVLEPIIRPHDDANRRSAADLVGVLFHQRPRVALFESLGRAVGFRHPLVALGAILAAYVVFDYVALAVLPLFFVFATVTASTTRSAAFLAGVVATFVVTAVPALHGDPLDAFHVLLPLGALGLAVVAGALLSRADD